MRTLVASDLIILGGAINEHRHRFLPLLRAHPELVPAQLRNDAGIMSAALAAERRAS
jgi:polyphosphate glucokinase